MENDRGAIMFNGSDISPHVKGVMFKVGVFLGSLAVGYCLEGKFKTCTNFYGIMRDRLAK
jgi:hypothetical protein